MIKMNKIAMLITTFIVATCVLFTSSITAHAATRSNGTNTVTITVTTKGNWYLPGSESITLGQSKGVRIKNTYNIFTGKQNQKKTNAYGTWKVSVVATDCSHSYTTKLTGSSLKLKLKPDKTYRITITWDGTADVISSMDKGCFSTYPSWYVKSTYKVSKYE